MPVVDRYDLNGDGVVDQKDIDILVEHYGPVDYSDPMSVLCDFNGDGRVSAIDGSMLLDRIGITQKPVSVSVRENIPLIILGGLAIFMFTKKRK